MGPAGVSSHSTQHFPLEAALAVFPAWPLARRLRSALLTQLSLQHLGQCRAYSCNLTLGQLNPDIFFLKYSQVQAKLLLCSIFPLWPSLCPTTSRMWENRPSVLEAGSAACWPAWASIGRVLLPVCVQERCLISDRWLSTCSDGSQEQHLRPSSELPGSEHQRSTETLRGQKCDILSLRGKGLGERSRWEQNL